MGDMQAKTLLITPVMIISIFAATKGGCNQFRYKLLLRYRYYTPP
jgi:hypothetical protein